MKVAITIFLIITCMVFIQSCKSTKYTIDNYDIPSLKFGNEGGFAGTSNEYILLENGQLFNKKPRANSFVELDPLDMSFVRQCFDNYENISQEAKNIHVPGNMTYWLGYDHKDVSTLSKWGGYEQEPNKMLKALYTNLTKIEKPSKTASK